MKSRILLASFFLIATIILAYFGYPTIKERYFVDKDNISVENENSNKEESAPINIADNSIAEDTEKTNDNIADEIENSPVPSEEVKEETDETGDVSNVTAEDCDNECENFKENTNDLKYCQNICDISTIKDSDNCEEKQGSDKDYCFKNQAVLKTDLSICNSISDTKIKSSCKSRVTEDLLEKQL